MKTKLITVNVTATDIRRGERVDCSRCPVARALLRRLKPKYKVVVNRDYALFLGTRDLIYFPEEVNSFIGNFDGGLTVKPFKFCVQIPIKYLK